MRKNWLMISIIIIAAALRIWRLDQIPPHLTSDEAALGYNAFSILKTGRDEYGKFLPIIFKSFGDFKPGLYVYAAVPFIATLGLNEFSVRLPSALAGVFAVWLIYRIVLKLLSEKGERLSKYSLPLATTSAFVLAISPWHIQFSRGAWEANLSLALTLIGMLCFIKSLEKPKYLIFSSIFFGLTLLAYQGAKLSTLIVILVLAITYSSELKKLLWQQRTVFISFFLGLLMTFPVLLSFSSGQTGRLNVFSVLSYPRPHDYLQNFLDEGKEKVGDLSYYLYHTETLNFTRGILGRWFNHFSGRFLFFDGDWQNPRHSPPNQGMLLLSDLLFLPLGIFFLLRNGSRLSKFTFLWLLLAPLPAALSRDQVHAVRALNMVIPFILISGAGLVFFVEIFKKLKVKSFRYLQYALLFLILSVSLTYYLDAYFVHLPKHTSQLWNYGYKQLVEKITPLESGYKEIKIQQSFAQPYIFFLFYQKYPPDKYQKQAKLSESEYKGDVGYIEKLDNICFCAIDWSIDRGDHGSIVVGDPVRIPKEDSKDPKQFRLIDEIKFMNGETAFRIVEVK